MTVHGIHHVTAISGDAQENLDFYAGVLGMRLVKKSINQDDPSTYHLFYADAEGHPGSDLTFFPWAHLAPSRKGVGLTTEVPLAVPVGSLEYWQERLMRYGTFLGALENRFGERSLTLSDPHGLELALVESDDARAFTPWEQSPVPVDKQIRGIHSVRLWERDLAKTTEFVTTIMGFSHIASENGWHRFGVAGAGSGKLLELREVPGGQRGQWGTGSVHHVAWRMPDEASELALRQQVEEAGRRPSPLIDRFWFKSVYFMEPGGVLFELATDGPGFTVDEDVAHLGEQLILPPWYEPQRPQIEAALPPLTAPQLPEKA